MSPETTRGLRAITTVALLVVCVAWSTTAVAAPGADAAPGANAASPGRGRATLRVEVLGLPPGQAPNAVLTGPHGLYRAVHTDQLTLGRATPGAYRLTLRPTTIEHASGPIRRGATATALHPTITISVRAGARAVLRATYSQLTNPGLHVLSHGVEAVRGPAEDPSAVVLPGDVSLARGNILSAPPNSVAPRGVLGRVTGVVHARGETTVGLGSVSIYEVAPNYEFNVPLVDATAAASGFSESCGPTVGVEPYRNIKDVSFTGGWSTADVFGVHVVDGVRAAVHFTVEAGVNVTAGTGVGCSLSVGFSADGMAGPIPVTAGIEAELEAEAALGGALSSGGSLRVEAGGHTVGPVLLPDVAFTSPHFSLTAKELVAASAGVGLTVKAGIGAGRVASITLNVGTSLDFTAQPGSCAWAARFGQFSAEGELLDWHLSTPKTPALFTLPIGGNYCASSPPSNGGGSGGSGSGGNGGGGTPPTSPPPTTPPPASPTDTPIAASGNDTCAIRAGGAVECWGQDDANQLGDENFVRPEIEECSLQWCSTIPRPVTGLTGAVSIATGGDEACALLSSGGVDCWGEGEYGELGDGEYNQSTAPVAVDGIMDATNVSVGEGADACAVLKAGGVDCWGQDDAGELGTGIEEGPETCRGNNKCSTRPLAVSGIGDATAVGVGALGGCALLSTGGVECWGDNTFDELGDGVPRTPSDIPVAVTGITTATTISVGPENACALLASGEVECWGENSYAQLGDGGTEASDSPVHVDGISDATAVTVEGWGACAILTTGEVECWGYNGTGGLADGSFTGPETCGEATAWCSKTPTRTSGVTSPTAISGGGLDACAELPGEVVECWGNNDYGQLGDASTTNSDEPVPVSGLG